MSDCILDDTPFVRVLYPWNVSSVTLSFTLSLSLSEALGRDINSSSWCCPPSAENSGKTGQEFHICVNGGVVKGDEIEYSHSIPPT